MASKWARDYRWTMWCPFSVTLDILCRWEWTCQKLDKTVDTVQQQSLQDTDVTLSIKLCPNMVPKCIVQSTKNILKTLSVGNNSLLKILWSEKTMISLDWEHVAQPVHVGNYQICLAFSKRKQFSKTPKQFSSGKPIYFSIQIINNYILVVIPRLWVKKSLQSIFLDKKWGRQQFNRFASAGPHVDQLLFCIFITCWLLGTVRKPEQRAIRALSTAAVSADVKDDPFSFKCRICGIDKD